MARVENGTIARLCFPGQSDEWRGCGNRGMLGPGRFIAAAGRSSRRSRCRRAAAAADPDKVLRIAFPVAETGFDPARVSDLYSNTVNEAIFERLLTYDYLARPAKLVPMVAEAMPEVTENGRTYTFRSARASTSRPTRRSRARSASSSRDDFVYSFKRFVDPKNRSPWAFMVEGKIEGLDALAEAAKKTGKFDYDAQAAAACEALDRYTLRIRLDRARLPVPCTRSRTRRSARWRARSSRPTATTRWRIRSAPGRTC